MKALSPNNAQTRVLNNHKSIKIVHHEFKGEITSSLEPQPNHKIFTITNTQIQIQTLIFKTKQIRYRKIEI